MTTIRCNNSKFKSVSFMLNGGRADSIMVFAKQNDEYWFTVGTYKNVKNAKRAAVKNMAKHGYTFDEAEMENLVID